MYQIHHPWHWLTYGNNAAALAAVGASIAAIFAFLAYRSAYEQVVLAQKSVEREHARYRNETTPHLTVEMDDVLESDPNWKWINIRNIGKGAARRNKAVLATCNSIPPSGVFRTQVQINGSGTENNGTQTVLLEYESTDGRSFRTQTAIVGIICRLWEGVTEINKASPPLLVKVGSRGPDDSFIEL